MRLTIPPQSTKIALVMLLVVIFIGFSSAFIYEDTNPFGLGLHWKFNEVNGSAIAVDSMGRVNFTLHANNTNFTTGVTGNALVLRGAYASETIAASASPVPEMTFNKSNFTIAFWFRAISGSGGTGYNLINKGAGDTQWKIQTQNGNNNLTFVNSNVLIMNTSVDVMDDKWHRIIWTREGTGSNQFKVYVDGVNIQNTTLTGDINDSTTNLTMERPNALQNVSIDDLRIYNNYSWTVNDVISDFFYNFLENSQTYNSATHETKNEVLNINLTYNNTYYPVITANLIYNGTSYAGTKVGTGSNIIFNKTISVPFLTGGIQQNYSFYWVIYLSNTTETYMFNSTMKNQTVNPIALGECVAGSTYIKALNITAFDQVSLVNISNWNFKSTIQYSAGLSTAYRTAYFNNLSIANNKEICINANITFYLNGPVEYSANNYQTGTYYFANTQINNLTTQLPLGMLNVGNNTNFIIQLNNQNNVPLAGYYIDINRCYANNITSCSNVQRIQTDSNGQSVVFIESYTAFYQFNIYNPSGVLVYSTDIRKIAPQVSPYTITLTIGSALPSPISYFNNITGLTGVLSWDKNTKILTLNYVDSNASFTSANLLVVLQNMSGPNQVICNKTNSNPSGVILCDLTGNSTGSYSAIFYLNRGGGAIFVDNLVFEIESFSAVVGMIGVFGFFLLILVGVFIFAFNEVAGIVAIDIFCVFGNFIGLVNLGILPLTAIIAISIIIIIVLERG